ncbi:MAG: FlxA-like family protein, partial [Ruminiclostridium sp.]|nr:FlxA-like family protein [Ruminiclostridium sp.]
MNIPSNSSTVFSLTGAQKGKTPAENGFSPKKEQEEDLRVQSLQEQINSLRTKIQELDENKELDTKGKAELKQTLREQMTELTSQLQQRRLEVRQEK